MQSKTWYFSYKGRVEGPFDLGELKARLHSTHRAKLWNSRIALWQSAERVLQHYKGQPLPHTNANHLNQAVILSEKTAMRNRLKPVISSKSQR
jgi:hypothetical protein